MIKIFRKLEDGINNKVIAFETMAMTKKPGDGHYVAIALGLLIAPGDGHYVAIALGLLIALALGGIFMLVLGDYNGKTGLFHTWMNSITQKITDFVGKITA